MASVGTPYNHARYLHATGALDLSSGTVKGVLVASSYTPDYDSHQFYDHITGELPSGSGYTAGGKALTYNTVTRVAKGAGFTRFLSDRIEWVVAGLLVARRLVLYKDSGVPSTSPLLGAILLDDTGGGQDVVAVSGQILRVTPDAVNGWWKL